MQKMRNDACYEYLITSRVEVKVNRLVVLNCMLPHVIAVIALITYCSRGCSNLIFCLPCRFLCKYRCAFNDWW